MRNIAVALSLVLGLLAPAAVHAGSISVFTLTNAAVSDFYGSNTLATESGTVTIDTATGTVLSEDIAIQNVYLPEVGPIQLDYVFNGPVSAANQGPNGYSPTYDSTIAGTATPSTGGVDNAFVSFYLALPVTSLVGYTGGPVCTIFSYGSCQDVTTLNTGNFDENFLLQYGGSLTLAATPEPSSLLLFATGMAGLAGVARRRFLSRRNS